MTSRDSNFHHQLNRDMDFIIIRDNLSSGRWRWCGKCRRAHKGTAPCPTDRETNLHRRLWSMWGMNAVFGTRNIHAR